MCDQYEWTEGELVWLPCHELVRGCMSWWVGWLSMPWVCELVCLVRSWLPIIATTLLLQLTMLNQLTILLPELLCYISRLCYISWLCYLNWLCYRVALKQNWTNMNAPDRTSALLVLIGTTGSMVIFTSSVTPLTIWIVLTHSMSCSSNITMII